MSYGSYAYAPLTGRVSGMTPLVAHGFLGPLAATGVQRYAWLLVAFPLAGAVILLLGGKRTNPFGHVIGVATPMTCPKEFVRFPPSSRMRAPASGNATSSHA